MEFLEEDLGRGDVTSESIIPKKIKARAIILAKESGVIAGMEEAEKICKSAGIKISVKVGDGKRVRKGDVIAKLSGNARKILGIERTLLNVVSHMSGIATMTRMLSKLAGKNVFIAATRKTLPGLRNLEKKAVMIAGGLPHRYDLSSMILVKDNHIRLLGGIDKMIVALKKIKRRKLVEIEVTDEKEAMKAAEIAGIIMFDNMEPSAIRKTIRKLRGGQRRNIIFEASGGINAKTIRRYAKTGVDFLSLGSLTNSSKALDISLEIL